MEMSETGDSLLLNPDLPSLLQIQDKDRHSRVWLAINQSFNLSIQICLSSMMSMSFRSRFSFLSSLLLTCTIFTAYLMTGCEGGADKVAQEIDSTLNIGGDDTTSTEDSTQNDIGDSTSGSAGENRDSSSSSDGRSGERPKLVWRFDFPDAPANEIPEGSVHLLINGKDRTIIPDAPGSWWELKRSEYETYIVPNDALTAAVSWWAGAGDVVYVVRQGDELVLMRRSVDEMEKAPQKYEEMFRFPI